MADLCEIHMCVRRRLARGLCSAHYRRWRLTGVRGGDIAPTAADLPTRFWAKVDKDGPIPERCPDLGPCWIWTGAVVSRYGQISTGGRQNAQAHRVSFELSGRTIPDGLVLDHLCGVTICVNPDHLDPVTQAENVRRAHRGVA
jgi:hypothetical protein